MGPPQRAMIVAPRGPTRSRIEAFLQERGVSTLCLRREGFLCEQPVAIEQDHLWIEGIDVLQWADAAIIVEPGLMWPVPMLLPTQEVWEQRKGDFDAYLRDEREMQSLWYSCLDLLNEAGIVRVNPSAAFALDAMKPHAFEVLRIAGVPLPPTILTNDPDALDRFIAQHSDPYLSVSLTGENPQHVDCSALLSIDLDVDPVFVQAVDPSKACHLQSVGGKLMWTSCSIDIDENTIRCVHDALHASWLSMAFHFVQDRWVLSDFSSAPRLEVLDSAAQTRVVHSLWELLQSEKTA